jgi:hypothetical protein
MVGFVGTQMAALFVTEGQVIYFLKHSYEEKLPGVRKEVFRKLNQFKIELCELKLH